MVQRGVRLSAHFPRDIAQDVISMVNVCPVPFYIVAKNQYLHYASITILPKHIF